MSCATKETADGKESDSIIVTKSLNPDFGLKGKPKALTKVSFNFKTSKSSLVDKDIMLCEEEYIIIYYKVEWSVEELSFFRM